jgi:hypothetical protein
LAQPSEDLAALPPSSERFIAIPLAPSTRAPVAQLEQAFHPRADKMAIFDKNRVGTRSATTLAPGCWASKTGGEARRPLQNFARALLGRAYAASQAAVACLS